MATSQSVQQPERRGFLAKFLAGFIGTLVGLVPGAAGLYLFFDPLKRGSQAAQKTKITTLEALPKDGAPRKFAIMASRADAWTNYPNTPIGAIYLRRIGERKVEALNVVCPHAGCFIDFRNDKNKFYCPCHDSSFNLDGSIADRKSPSSRAMDSLEVEVRDDGEVWVRFQNFKTGHAQKIPVS